MCAISGLLSFRAPLSPTLIGDLTSTLQHRGPDDEGYIAADTQQENLKVGRFSGPHSKVPGECPLREFQGRANLYLGHRRLSILDLSAAGHQRRSEIWRSLVDRI